ncbi:MAG: flagellar basal body L-ring protein FlgH [Alphaproteobacteria bacterium]|nr:flagellar basal body L-ring protein FlgH [Alphaproteobacteria bacterium]
MKNARLLPLALAAAAASCASSMDNIAALPGDARAVAGHAFDAARRAAAPPPLHAVESPAPLTGGGEYTMPAPAETMIAARAPNSLWQPGARNFFRDQRAGRIGDILTVAIEIDDSAELRNNSQRQRTSNTEVGVPNLLGLETSAGRFFGGGFDPAALISADAASSAAGQGSINREEKIDLSVAAVIVEVLPNGNFVIAGRQQVRINAELRELTVSGVIRPADIDASNRIRHDQIAEARIDYGGRGQLSAVQRPRIGQRVADSVSPW